MITKKKLEGFATIDVALIVLRVGGRESGVEYALDTANKIGVVPQVETQEAIKLIKLGKLLAQKLPKSVITGHQLTLLDNVFIPQLMKIFQGGNITGTGQTTKYTPPVAGSSETGEVFELDAYSAVYDASGQILMYEKITYPNCQGTPVAINTEDNVFRLPEYVINSAPKKGQAPYDLDYVLELPDFSEASIAQEAMMMSEPVAETNGVVPYSTDVSVK